MRDYGVRKVGLPWFEIAELLTLCSLGKNVSISGPWYVFGRPAPGRAPPRLELRFSGVASKELLAALEGSDSAELSDIGV